MGEKKINKTLYLSHSQGGERPLYIDTFIEREGEREREREREIEREREREKEIERRHFGN